MEAKVQSLVKETKSRCFMSQYPAVKCPTCRKQGQWLEESYGPFCSARCKMIDLGKWFDEEMAIKEPLFQEDSAEDSSDWPLDGIHKQSE